MTAIRNAKVRVIRDQTGLVTDYKTEGDFPKFGNNDNRVDQLATWVVSTFMTKLRKYPTYRHAMHTPEFEDRSPMREGSTPFAYRRGANARASNGYEVCSNLLVAIRPALRVVFRHWESLAGCEQW